jgi:hypothetical protein
MHFVLLMRFALLMPAAVSASAGWGGDHHFHSKIVLTL